MKGEPMETVSHEETWVERFAAIDRITHAILFTTFLGLSLTGLPLLFAFKMGQRGVALDRLDRVDHLLRVESIEHRGGVRRHDCLLE